MNKQELLNALRELGMRPGKILGQNFLTDPNLLDFIVREARPLPGEVMLEAGPGFGTLTRPLLDSGAEVYAIEFDRRLCEYLRKNLLHPRFHLIEGDACRVDIAARLPENRPFRAIANLPYSISSIFIARLLELENPPTGMLFMLQKETGMRLAASTKNKNYGALSVRAQHFYQVKLLRTVTPKVFYPQPEVASALVKFELNGAIPPLAARLRLAGIVRTAFAQRRKKIFKPLASAYGAAETSAALARLNIPEDARPGDVSVDDYVKLAELL